MSKADFVRLRGQAVILRRTKSSLP